VRRPHGVGDRRQHRQAFDAPVPAGDVQVEPLGDVPGAVAQLGRQRGVELELGRREHRAEAQLGRGHRQPGQRQRLGLLLGHPGEPGAVAVDQAVTAGPAAIGVHRDAGGRQRVDVPVDRPHRHLELFGQLLGRHPAAVLQQQEDGQETARAHGRNSGRNT
jgi:hypothetical protein